MSRLSQVLVKCFIAVSALCFFLGWFLFAFGYTAFGWSSVIAWKNATSCSVQSSFVDRRPDPQSANGRNIFEVTSTENKVFRQAAVASMHDAQFLAKADNAALAVQAASYLNRTNVSCNLTLTIE